MEYPVGDACGFHKPCRMEVAETGGDLTEPKMRADDLRKTGCDHDEVIERATCLDQLPAVNPGCVGGMVVRGDGHASPFGKDRPGRFNADAIPARP